jgi:broad specificity phosphatase PhoE
MTIVYLVRHGESDFNRRGIFRGTIDVPLNEHGGLQAEALGRALAKTSLSAVYSSPLGRAVDTAHAVALHHDLEVTIDPHFTNIRLGIWQGKPKAEVAVQFPHEWSLWTKSPEKLLIPEGESLGEIRDRAWERVVQLVQREHVGEQIAIVTHRSIIKVILGAAIDLETGYFWKFHIDTASFSTVSHSDEVGFSLHQLNIGCGIPSSGFEEF